MIKTSKTKDNYNNKNKNNVIQNKLAIMKNKNNIIVNKFNNKTKLITKNNNLWLNKIK